VGIGLLVAGGAYAAATGNLDTFAGGVIGGVGGVVAGKAASNAIQNLRNPVNQVQKNVGVNDSVGNQSNRGNNALDVNQGKKASEVQALGNKEPYHARYEKTEIATRYVGDGEAEAIMNNNGIVPNVKSDGITLKNVFYTNDLPLNSASGAQQAYQLPNTPTYRVTVITREVVNIYGGNVQGGTGSELITRQQMQAIEVIKLNQ